MSICCCCGCYEKAEFVIKESTRSDIDNFTHSCASHVGELLGTTDGFPECSEWIVYKISCDE